MNISHAVSPRLNLYGACRTPPKQEVHRTAVWPWGAWRCRRSNVSDEYEETFAIRQY